MTRLFFTLSLFCLVSSIYAQRTTTSNHGNYFEQLDSKLRTPNTYRGSDGAPGPDYWQQQADYKIDCRLDTENQQLFGEETIKYYNRSPHTLSYLWLQLDENQHKGELDHHHFNGSDVREVMNQRALAMLEQWKDLTEFGHNIEAVTDASGKPLDYLINGTMMRVNLPKKLKP